MNDTQAAFLLDNRSIGELQQFADSVYGGVNGRHFELTDMFGRLAEYVSRVCLWERKHEAHRVSYHLSMALSWLFAIVNRLFPASSGVNIHELLKTHCAVTLLPAAPLAELQMAFAEKHRGVSAAFATICLAEKVLALGSALGKFRATHEEELLQLAAKRLAQSTEALLVVAAILNIPMNTAFQCSFGGGCPKCKKSPCECEFRIDAVK